MERKGQGAIEYLLIIGAAILVVAIVIVAITSVTATNKNISTADQNRANNTLKCISNYTALGPNPTNPVGVTCPPSDTNKARCECCNTGSQNIDTTKINKGISCT